MALKFITLISPAREFSAQAFFNLFTLIGFVPVSDVYVSVSFLVLLVRSCQMTDDIRSLRADAAQIRQDFRDHLKQHRVLVEGLIALLSPSFNGHPGSRSRPPRPPAYHPASGHSSLVSGPASGHPSLVSGHDGRLGPNSPHDAGAPSSSQPFSGLGDASVAPSAPVAKLEDVDPANEEDAEEAEERRRLEEQGRQRFAEVVKSFRPGNYF